MAGSSSPRSSLAPSDAHLGRAHRTRAAIIGSHGDLDMDGEVARRIGGEVGNIYISMLRERRVLHGESVPPIHK
jgi:hypothetical protein